ncbi:hypothetical protein VPH35_057132 [Triticum aestivum]
MSDSGVPRRRRTGFVVPAAAMPQESAGAGSSSGSVVPVGQRENVAVPRPRSESEEEERKRKGKMPAVDQSLPPPVETKLMGDAIRAHANTSTSPPVENKLMSDAIGAHANASTPTPFAAYKDVPFDYDAVSQRLRDVLGGLGVVAGPVCVYEKVMTISDRGKDQNRLLISCKDGGDKNKSGSKKGKKKKQGSGGGDDEHRAAAIFAKIFSHEEELKVLEGQAEAEGMEKKKKLGLGVQAYDRHGEMYELKCRYLPCNSAYRFIDSDYGRFLGNNGLLVLVDPDRKKRKRSPEAAEGSDGQGGSPLAMGAGTEGKKKRRKGKTPSPEAAGSDGQSSSPSPEPDGGEQKVRPARIELWAFRSPKLTQGCTDHADGKLGLVLLHYLEGDGAEGERVEAGRVSADEPEPRSSEEEDAMEPAMPNAGDKMAIDVPDVVALPAVLVEDGAGAHEDAVPVVDEDEDVMEPAMPNVGAHEMAVHAPDVVLPVLAVAGAHEEDAVHAPNEDAVPVMDADERTRLLEAAEGLLLLSEAPVVF